MRMVLLKPTDNTDESEKALVGNTMLVAQPTPEMIASELPPTEAEQASYFNVIYGASSNQAMLGKKSFDDRQTGISGMRQDTRRTMCTFRREKTM